MIKYIHILLAILIFAVAVPIGFAEILPEAYQERQTVIEMDETAMLATAINRGLYERCLVAQVTPLSFAVANKIGWYFDQSAREAVDTKIKTLVPYYVDPDTVYDGTTNIAMLVTNSLWAKLEIGDQKNLFTGTPASGTNAATYGDYPWRVYSESLEERHKVIQAQKQTTQDVYHVMNNAYIGHGRGTTYEEAYNAAVADYHESDNEYSEVRQHCKIAFWSNMVAQGGSGATNESGLPVAGTEWNDWHEDHHDYIRTDLIISETSTTNNLTVSYSDIINIIHTYTTNLIVTGEDLDPNIAGTYVEIAPYVDFRRWEGTLGAILSGSYTNNVGNIGVTVGGTYWTWLGTMWTPEGDYTPFPLGGGVPTGTAHVVYDVIETITTNGATPVDYSGTYYPTINADIWQGSKGYIFITNGLYTIYSSLELNTDEAYLSSGTKLGMYSAVNFTATNIVSAGGGGSQPCVGTYDGIPGGGEPWTMGSWACTNSEGVFTIRDTSDSITSIWVKAGDDTNPVGIYASSGPEYFGSVTSTLLNVYNDWHEDHHDPVYHTNTWGISTIFYECWLRKGAPSQSWSIAATNIEHRESFWAYPFQATYGTVNYYNDEGMGLNSNVWNTDAIGDWTDWTFDSSVAIDDYWTSELYAPPDITTEPTTVNESVCSGFWIADWKGIVEWDFQYCTDE